MNKIVLMLVIALILISGNLIAQNVAIAFKDYTKTTKDLVNQEFGKSETYPDGYPFPTLANSLERWVIQFYRDGGDNKISPVDSLGNPTGDDSLAVGIANTTQALTFAPNGGLYLNAGTFMALSKLGNTHPGDKIYLRIFNSPSISTATKYIQFKTLYSIQAGQTQNVTIIPTYGWSDWLFISR